MHRTEAHAQPGITIYLSSLKNRIDRLWIYRDLRAEIQVKRTANMGSRSFLASENSLQGKSHLVKSLLVNDFDPPIQFFYFENILFFGFAYLLRA